MIETSGPACSVALARVMGETWELVAELPAPGHAPLPEMEHTAQLLPMIRALLPEGGFGRLRAVACSSGPGSYTALRAGLSSAKGICLALDKVLLQASTLRGLAAAGRDLVNEPTPTPGGSDEGSAITGVALALVPARRNEVYAALYAADLTELAHPAVYENTEAWRRGMVARGVTLVCSPDVTVLAGFGESPFETAVVPLRASNLLSECALRIKKNSFDDLASTAPLYLRPPHITKAKNRL